MKNMKIFVMDFELIIYLFTDFCKKIKSANAGVTPS